MLLLSSLRPAMMRPPQLLVRQTHYRVKRLDGVPTTTYILRNIRTSPWRLNLITKLVRRMWVPEALTQLKFCQKRFAPTVAEAIQEAAKKAGLEHELVSEELEVERAFVTPAPFKKKIDYKAKGMSGVIRNRSGHITIVLAKLPFDKYINDAKNWRQKQKWSLRAEEAMKERKRVLGDFADVPLAANDDSTSSSKANKNKA
mmetsp:Transcript_38065/g.122213  ORF Transcript_38065/g.122213 Transcript_38065/m.122213 type:complete len:201 (-) Transcript_38065:96-698(-)